LPFLAYSAYSNYYLGHEGDIPYFRIHTSSTENNEYAGEGCQDCTIRKLNVEGNNIEVWTDKNGENPVALIVNTKKFYPNIYNFIIQQLDPKTQEAIEFSDGELDHWIKTIKKW